VREKTVTAVDHDAAPDPGLRRDRDRQAERHFAFPSTKGARHHVARWSSVMHRRGLEAERQSPHKDKLLSGFVAGPTPEANGGASWR
jgi:hypothetical protein